MMTLLSSLDIQSNLTIQLVSDVLTFYQGSIYLYCATNPKIHAISQVTTKSTITITGFPLIPANSLITITMRVYVPMNPNFKIEVAVGDMLSVGNSPIMKSSVTSPNTLVPNYMVSSFTGSQGEPNKLSLMSTPDNSFISFTFASPSPSSTGSYL
jgi:hypothetical protein